MDMNEYSCSIVQYKDVIIIIIIIIAYTFSLSFNLSILNWIRYQRRKRRGGAVFHVYTLRIRDMVMCIIPNSIQEKAKLPKLPN